MKFYNPRFSLTAREDKIESPENLVFSGGGILGLAYVGAMKALQEKKLLGNIKRYAGASAGAITAALLAIGFTPEELEKEIVKINFGDFLKKSPVNIEAIAKDPNLLMSPENAPLILLFEIGQFGLCDGSVFNRWFLKMLKTKFIEGSTAFSKSTTFSQLYAKKGIELSIVLCHANTSKTVIASHKNKELANMPIATAVRASMAIPFIYEPVVYPPEDALSKQNIYVDGGTMYNYPIEIFDDYDPKKTLGFILGTEASILNPTHKKDTNLITHIACLMDAIKNVSYEYCFRMGNAYRTIFIDTAGINMLNFSLTNAQKQTLITNGHSATLEYFQTNK